MTPKQEKIKKLTSHLINKMGLLRIKLPYFHEFQGLKMCFSHSDFFMKFYITNF